MSFKDIALSLIDMRYAPGKSSGFILSKVQDDIIFARHVTETLTETTITSPYGDIEVFHVKDYLVNEFELSDGLLKVNDATKSLAKLRQDLSKATNYRNSISSISLDLMKVSRYLSERKDDIRITSMDVVTYGLIPQSTVKMSIESNRCVMEKASKHLGDQPFEVRKLGIESEAGKAEISHRGNIKISGTDFYSDYFHRVLEKVISNRL